MARKQDLGEQRERFALVVTLSPEQEDALVQRVAERLQEGRDDGFIDARAAGRYLGGISPKAVYALRERGRIRGHHIGGRVLFDPAALRQDVERGQ